MIANELLTRHALRYFVLVKGVYEDMHTCIIYHISYFSMVLYHLSYILSTIKYEMKMTLVFIVSPFIVSLE